MIRKYLCADRERLVMNLPEDGCEFSIYEPSIGGALLQELSDIPAATQILLFVLKLVILDGNEDSANWARCTRRQIAKDTGYATRTICRALDLLLSRGYLVRSPRSNCVYRIPAKFLFKGALEKLPEPEIDNSELTVLIMPPEKTEAETATIQEPPLVSNVS